MTQTRSEANSATSSVKEIAARLPSSTAPKTSPATKALTNPLPPSSTEATYAVKARARTKSCLEVCDDHPR